MRQKIPELSLQASLQRREALNFQIPEAVASIADEHNHTLPAEIASQRVRIVAREGIGYLPFESSIPDLEQYLDPPEMNQDLGVLPDITVLFVVTHGVLRNVRDYLNWQMEALGDDLDTGKILVVAPQFPAPVDNADEETLRWGFNDWRGGEPALEPSAPISSFTAKDALIAKLISVLPDLKLISFRNNSEGAQMDDRYLTFSKYLRHLQASRNIQVFGRIFNPGTVLYFDSIRPNLESFNGEQFTAWKHIDRDSLANRWPFGLFDGTHEAFGPPPYVRQVLDSIGNNAIDSCMLQYAQRATFAVGKLDNDPDASQLPIGIGPDEQGSTRLQRVSGKAHRLMASFADLGYQPSFARLYDGWLQIYRGLGHAASDMFQVSQVHTLQAPTIPELSDDPQ